MMKKLVRKKKGIIETSCQTIPEATVKIAIKDDYIKIAVDGEVIEHYAIPLRANIVLTYPEGQMTVESGDRYVYFEWYLP
jgi:hypothetical protein